LRLCLLLTSAGLWDLLPRQRSYLPMLLALVHGPRHASTSSGATCGGKNSGRSRGSLAVHCCPPRPWTALPQPGPRGPSTGPLTTTFVMVRATLLTLAPTIRRVPVLATRPQSRVSSLGVVQRTPLHRLRSRSPTPGSVRAPRLRGARLASLHRCKATNRFLRDEDANPHPACRLRGLAPPWRFTPP
jgi:hypothetical protein